MIFIGCILLIIILLIFFTRSKKCNRCERYRKKLTRDGFTFTEAVKKKRKTSKLVKACAGCG